MAELLLENYEAEVEKWESVNRELKHHGLRSVKLVQPSVLIQSSEVVGFTCDDSSCLRDNLIVLMKDGDRRQTLIQDLILTNNNLRTEMETKGSSDSEYDERLADLQNMLDGANSRIQELEAQLEQQKDLTNDKLERDQNTKAAAQARHKQLEKRCELQEEELERLRSKVKRLNTEQDEREKRVKGVLQDMKRGNRGMSTSDKRLIDIVDSYESELCQLKRKLVLQDDKSAVKTQDVDFMEETSHRYKELIKTFNRDLRHCEVELKKEREKCELVQLELQARPSVDNHNKAKQKIRQLEKILQEHSINIYGGDAFNKKVYSTKTEDVDYLPLTHCRRYIKEVCKLLELSDLDQLELKISSQKNAVEGYPRLEEILGQIVEVIEPSLVKDMARKHKMWCSKHWKNLIPKLEVWSKDMLVIPEMRHAVVKMLKQFDKSEDCLSKRASLSDMVEALECITVEIPPTSHTTVKDEIVSHKVLLSMVRHFQHLFDVSAVSGVYPRMSELYAKHNEMVNVMRTLAQLLDLGENYKGSDIVDTVGRVCQSYTSSTYKQLKQLLQEDDLDSVIERLDEHGKFMPLFRQIIDQLMDILDVTRIDQVIPSAKALKLMVS